MDNILQTALAEAVNSLASFFGTTTEAIKEYGMWVNFSDYIGGF